jgi:hypothetical protein
MALTTEDTMSIHQLYAAACHAIDDGDGASFRSCFTPDGSLGGVGSALSGEKLAAFADSFRDPSRQIRHLVSGVLVEGDADAATGRAYLVAFRAGEDAKFLTSGRYRDRLQRIDGRWLFAERRFTPDG